LEVATGKVSTQAIPDHTSATVVGALKCHIQQVDSKEQIHYICDNYASHSTMEMCQTVAELCEVILPDLATVEERRAWLSTKYKRIVFHFLPFHGSWLNLIENWFGILQEGIGAPSVRSENELAQIILDFTDTWNEKNAKPFNWSYDGKDLRGKTVRKLAYWIREEAKTLTAKALSRQLELMSNLMQKERCLVSKRDWELLGESIEDKLDYLYRIVENINEIDFQKTKAKTEVIKQEKIREKILKQKRDLREQIEAFRKLHVATMRLL
jgi:transposase